MSHVCGENHPIIWRYFVNLSNLTVMTSLITAVCTLFTSILRHYSGKVFLYEQLIGLINLIRYDVIY